LGQESRSWKRLLRFSVVITMSFLADQYRSSMRGQQ
jgi:hypothetical protein